MDFSTKLSQIETFLELWAPKMTSYGLGDSCEQKYYRLEQFSGVRASKMLYLGQYCRFLFSHGFQHQISPNGSFLRILDTENDIICMALVALLINNTID